jgi:hypothetical protein
MNAGPTGPLAPPPQAVTEVNLEPLIALFAASPLSALLSWVDGRDKMSAQLRLPYLCKHDG